MPSQSLTWVRYLGGGSDFAGAVKSVDLHKAEIWQKAVQCSQRRNDYRIPQV